LVQCAKGIGGPSTQPSIQVSLDDQALYDAAVAAIAAGNLDLAQRLFLSLQQRTPDASDTAVWIALIPAARGDWQAARTLLKDASQNGPPQSRGLANQLFSVVCALEDRPDAVIQHMLAGQRMLGRNAAPSYIPEQPKPESVWFSDSMK
jgi:predicted Zn-dependent protease